MLTVYALSLLTNRTFLIKNELSKNCYIQNYLLPNKFDWLPNNKLKYRKTQQVPFKWKGLINESEFTKINFLKSYTQIDLLKASTYMNLIKHLTINPDHHERIKQLGFTIDTFNLESLIHKFYTHLFKLSPELNSRLNSILEQFQPSNHKKSPLLICTQIRIGGIKENRFAQRNQAKEFWNFIKTNFLANNTIKNYKLFVTSDNAQVIDEAYKEFGADKVIGFRNNSFHITLTKNKSCDDVGNLIIDFHILGKCDKVVVSHSGFGILGMINRESNDYTNLYVYTNPNLIKSKFWNRKNLTFYRFDSSFLYLEYFNNI